MTREPIVSAHTRYVRVVANILTEECFSPLLFDCTNARKQKTEGSRKVRFSTLQVMAL